MSDPTSDDFDPRDWSAKDVQRETIANIGGIPVSMPPGPSQIAPPPQESSLDRVMKGMRKYVDEQDGETRKVVSAYQAQVEEFAAYVNREHEFLLARVATLEAQNGSEGYRQHLVAELRRISAKD